jgi:hypothetical protein
MLVEPDFVAMPDQFAVYVLGGGKIEPGVRQEHLICATTMTVPAPTSRGEVNAYAPLRSGESDATSWLAVSFQ